MAPRPAPQEFKAAAPAGDAFDLSAWRTAAKKLSATERERLADLFSSAELARLRKVEQAEAIVRLRISRAGADRPLAEAVVGELTLYRNSSWLADQYRSAPTDPRHVAMFELLRATAGEIPSARTLRRIWASWAK